MKSLTLILITISATTAFADVVVPINAVTDKGIGDPIGQVTVTGSKYGVVFTPSLQGLSPGAHGFHLHENGSCEPKEKDGKMVAAGAAGAHYDPAGTKAHGTPWGEGHLGDLPALYAEASGSAAQPVMAPRLKLKDLKGRAIMVHAGGDNHSDQPSALGGGGARVACGVIKQ